MLETAELGRKVGKQEYNEQVPLLRTELLLVQNQLRESAEFSAIVIVAGSDAAGKGRTVNLLHEWMDPRFLQTHAFDQPTEEESERPLAWRYWRVLPPKGRISVFLGSWYTEVIFGTPAGGIGRGRIQADAGASEQLRTAIDGRRDAAVEVLVPHPEESPEEAAEEVRFRSAASLAGHRAGPAEPAALRRIDADLRPAAA
jgi:hypothetical protein